MGAMLRPAEESVVRAVVRPAGMSMWCVDEPSVLGMLIPAGGAFEGSTVDGGGSEHGTRKTHARRAPWDAPGKPGG